jgi:hypothetical protein
MSEEKFYEKARDFIIEKCIERDIQSAQDAFLSRSFASFLKDSAKYLSASDLNIPEKILIGIRAELNATSDDDPEALALYDKFNNSDEVNFVDYFLKNNKANASETH